MQHKYSLISRNAKYKMLNYFTNSRCKISVICIKFVEIKGNKITTTNTHTWDVTTYITCSVLRQRYFEFATELQRFSTKKILIYSIDSAMSD